MAERPRVLVVVGMHRTGTSAFTAGLPLLGVDLGDRLIPAGPTENAKGFFEDAWVLDLSERLLGRLDLRWHSTSAPVDGWWRRREFDALRLEARDELRRRIAGEAIWGFKNPRTARLLPFWQEVLEEVGADDSYLLTVRNPLSVARSLASRNGFHPTKSYTLWLLHVADAVRHTQGRHRVFADYDDLIADPVATMRRIGRRLDLRLSAKGRAALEAHGREFIEDALRHSRFEADDLALDPDLPPLAVRAFGSLHGLATDRVRDTGGVEREWREIGEAIDSLRPLLAHLEHLERQGERREQEISEARAGLEGRLREAEGTLARERQASEQAAAQRAEDHRALEARREELALQAARLEAELGASRERIEEEREARQVARTELERARTEVAGAERARAVLETEIAAARDEAARRDERIGELRAEAQDLAGSLREERQRSEEIRAALDRERLEAQAAAAESRRELEASRIDAQTTRSRAEVAEAAAAESRRELEASRREAETERGGRLEAQAALARAREETLAERARAVEAEGAAEDVAGTLAEVRVELHTERAAREQLQKERDAAAGESRLARDAAARAEARAAEGARQIERERDEHAAAEAASLARGARRLALEVEGWRRTRTWQTARWLQRRLDGLRRRTGRDDLQALGVDASAFAALCSREPLPREELRAHRERMDALHAVLTAAETWRLARTAAFLWGVLRLRPPGAGPAERAAALLGALGLALDTTGRPDADRRPADRVVDVIVPAHGGVEETRRCLESVRRAEPRTPYELIVIDDSGGANGMRSALKEWQPALGFTLLENPENLGYVASVNRGMTCHPGRDVVLLNSDTTVHGDWLDRLRRAAYSEWRTGTATPWSNNAEICSYPRLCVSAEMPDGEEAARLDGCAARANAGRTATLPTSIGFCTFIRRECLDDVGLFDQDCFGKGYGEENDFSMRARHKGWRHVLAADTFVAHAGGVSFGASKSERIREAMAKIAEMHPSYLPEVHAFVGTDPLRGLRRRIDAERVNGSGTALLLVSHALGGGTARHVNELCQRWEAEGCRAYLLTPDGGAPGRVVLQRLDAPETPNLCLDLPAERAVLHELLRALGVRHVHFHHTLQIPEELLALPAALGVPYDFTVHDYLSICPRVHMLDGSGRFCDDPDDVRVCSDCVRENGSPAGADIDVGAWRESFRRTFEGARRVFVPSRDVAGRLERHFPKVVFTHRPHFEPRREALDPLRRRNGERMRIALIGALGPHKGVEVLAGCARDAQRRRLPIEFHVIGYTDRDEELRKLPGVTISGPYEERDAPRLLSERKCHAALLPSIWPETYCYTLTLALQAGLLPVAFDLGAIAERIRALGWGLLLPLDTGAKELNDRLLSLEVPPFPRTRLREQEASYASLRADYYENPF